MSPWIVLALLAVSNTFMTFAWYGQIKLAQMKIVTSDTPLWIVILGSWGVALIEYIFLVPANRYGFSGNGGPFSLVELRVVQEVVSLLIFSVIVTLLFKGEALHWNHFVAFALLVAAVWFVFMDA